MLENVQCSVLQAQCRGRGDFEGTLDSVHDVRAGYCIPALIYSEA